MTLPIIPSALYGAIDLYPNVETTALANSVGLATEFDVPLPASLSVGNLVLVLINVANVTGTTTITPQGGWNELYNAGTQGNIRRWVAYWREIDGLEGGVFPIEVSLSSLIASAAYQISNWSGIEADDSSGNFDTIANPASFTPSWGLKHCLWIAAAGRASSSTVSAAPTDYDNLDVSTLALGIGVQVMTARRELRAASENPGAFDVAASFWRGATIAIKGYG